jgi:RNA polymerase sigma factor (sigma-70 family)
MDEKKEYPRKYYTHNNEILELIKIFKTSSAAEKKNIKSILVKKLEYFVYSKAKRYGGRHYYQDLLQEAKIALIIAFEDFDLERGINFFKFAEWYIRNKIRRFAEKQYRYEKLCKNNGDDLLEKPCADEINPEEILKEKEKRIILSKAVNNLPYIDKEVVLLRFGVMDEECTFKQIGKKLFFSKQRAEQIKTGALLKLKRNSQVKIFGI